MVSEEAFTKKNKNSFLIQTQICFQMLSKKSKLCML